VNFEHVTDGCWTTLFHEKDAALDVIASQGPVVGIQKHRESLHILWWGIAFFNGGRRAGVVEATERMRKDCCLSRR
jgi:hypothetical protein